MLEKNNWRKFPFFWWEIYIYIFFKLEEQEVLATFYTWINFIVYSDLRNISLFLILFSEKAFIPLVINALFYFILIIHIWKKNYDIISIIWICKICRKASTMRKEIYHIMRCWLANSRGSLANMKPDWLFVTTFICIWNQFCILFLFFPFKMEKI